MYKKFQKFYTDFEYTTYFFDKKMLQKIFENIYLQHSFKITINTVHLHTNQCITWDSTFILDYFYLLKYFVKLHV